MKISSEITGLMRRTAIVIDRYLDQDAKCHLCGADTNIVGMFLRLRPDIIKPPKVLDRTVTVLVCFDCKDKCKMVGEGGQ